MCISGFHHVVDDPPANRAFTSSSHAPHICMMSSAQQQSPTTSVKISSSLGVELAPSRSCLAAVALLRIAASGWSDRAQADHVAAT